MVHPQRGCALGEGDLRQQEKDHTRAGEEACDPPIQDVYVHHGHGHPH